MIALSLCMLALGSPGAPPSSTVEEEPVIPPTILLMGGSPTPTVSPAPKKDLLKTDPAEAEALSSVLRELLKKYLPDPVTKTSHNWGNQKNVTTTQVHRDGLKFWTEHIPEMKNDGTWRKADIRIADRDKITLAVTELTHPQEGRIQVTVSAVAERVDLHFEQQVWKNGVRLYSGETRGHCKGALTLKAEVITRAEITPGSFIPNVSLKLQVNKAELFYEKLVVDHAAGLDGQAAKAIGDLTINIIKAIKPHLEQDLLEKADAAIVKAAQKKELTVTLDKLMAAKKKEPDRKEPEKKQPEKKEMANPRP